MPQVACVRYLIVPTRHGWALSAGGLELGHFPSASRALEAAKEDCAPICRSGHEAEVFEATPGGGLEQLWSCPGQLH